PAAPGAFGFLGGIERFVPERRAQKAASGAVEEIEGIGPDSLAKLLLLSIQESHLAERLVLPTLSACGNIGMGAERGVVQQSVLLQTLRLIQFISRIRLDRDQ